MALNGLLVVLFQFQISKWATDKPVGKTMLYGACLFGIGLFYRLVTEVVWRIGYKCYNYFNNVTVCVCHIYIRRDDYVACTDDVCSEFGPEHLRGTYMGAASLQWITGNAFGPLLGGFIRSITWSLPIYNFSYRMCSCRCCIYFFRSSR